MHQIVTADEDFVRRLVEGTGTHAARRRDEMRAAAEMLEELGVGSAMARATVDNLTSVLADGVPEVP